MNVLGRITGLFSTALDIATGVLVVLATGIYFAFHPETYTEALMTLAPREIPNAMTAAPDVPDNMPFEFTATCTKLPKQG